jgi:cytochrome c
MIIQRLAIACLVWFTVEVHECSAQGGPPDTSNGHAIAERICVACHAIGPGYSGEGRADVPSFVAIAQDPNMTQDRITGAIVMPHPQMPAVPLSRREVGDLVAYIQSLKPVR